MKTIVWVHGDKLATNNPAFLTEPQAPALFVFDDQLMVDYKLSFKRLLFMYECLLEMPVIIRRGDPATELARFALEQKATRILTTASPSPRFQSLVDQLKRDFEVTILEVPPLVEDRPYNLERFSRYWKQARKFVGTPSQKPQ